MRGTRLRATIPVTQEVLDSLLSSLRLHIELQGNNHIQVSYRGIRVAAELIGISTELMLVLSTSWISRTAIRAVLALKPEWRTFFDQKDKFVYILCAEIPAVARYRYLWRFISKIDARTATGLLLLDAEIDIP